MALTVTTSRQIESFHEGKVPKHIIDQYVSIKTHSSKYKSPAGNQQIREVMGSTNKAYCRLFELISRKIKNIQGSKPSPIISIQITNRLLAEYTDDRTLYNTLKQYVIANNEQRFSINISRDNMHAEMYYNYITEVTDIDVNSRYLDVGCGDGYKTGIIGNKLGLSSTNIYGADVPNWGHYDETERNSNITFNFILAGKLPYDDNYFDIISAFMVLHHIEELEETLKEIHRCLTPGGIFVVREHDTVDDIDWMLNDIEHGIYTVALQHKCSANWRPFPSGYYAKYYAMLEWEVIMDRFGFELVSKGYDTISIKFDVSPTRYCHMIFRKKK